MTEPSAAAEPTPRHVWAVGIFALLWDSLGAFDYLMTQTQNEQYMSQFTPEQLEFFYGFPTWLVAVWAIAVWGGVLGSVLILMRKRWAAPVLGISFGAMVLTSIHNFGFANGLEIMGPMGAVFSVLIFVIALALWMYARAMVRKGVFA